MNELSTNLTPAEIATGSKRIITLEKEEKEKAIKEAIKQCYFITGVKIPTKQDLLLTVGLLMRDVETRYKKITAKGLLIAFQDGSRKEYGEYYGLNLVTFNDWIKGYLKSEKRKQMLEIEIDPNKGISQEDIDKIRNSYLERCFYVPFDIYKDSKEWTFSDKAITGKHGLYQLLKFNGHCKWTNEEKQKMKAVCIERYGEKQWIKNFEKVGIKFLMDKFISTDTDVTTLITKFIPSGIEITN